LVETGAIYPMNSERFSINEASAGFEMVR